MPSPEVWGPPVWTLFHVLAEKVNEHVYPRIVGQLFDIIKRICTALPCPECSQDASIFLGKIKLHELKTKNDFKNMIYVFHNYVNSKKRKKLYNYSNLEIYKRYNIVYVFNRFISVYHTKGNMNLIAESFQRQMIVKNVRDWFSRNLGCFISRPPQPENSIQEPLVQEPIVQETLPIAEEPIVQEPFIEEPIVQEPSPIIQEPSPIIEEPAHIIEEPIVQESIIQEPAPIIEEPIIQEPVAIIEEQIVEEPIIEEPIVQEEVAPVIEEQVISEGEQVISEGEQVVSEGEQVVLNDAKEEPIKSKRGRKKKTV